MRERERESKNKSLKMLTDFDLLFLTLNQCLVTKIASGWRSSPTWSLSTKSFGSCKGSKARQPKLYCIQFVKHSSLREKTKATCSLRGSRMLQASVSLGTWIEIQA